MRNVVILFALLFAFSPRIGAADAAGPSPRGSVVLLHGLARTSDSMAKMARALEADGYRVCNVSYPSREHTIEVLTADFVAPAVRACLSNEPGAVHFVTHSLGGIIVRQLVKSTPALRIGRVVMLSPPNHGSDVVDKLGTWGLFGLVNGPAGQQLGTGRDSIPQTLGPAAFEVGILTGSRTINPILSLLIPGTDDGKVSIQSAQLEGMRDFCVIPSSHPFIMSSDPAIEQTLVFLAGGRFTCHATDAAGSERRAM